ARPGPRGARRSTRRGRDRPGPGRGRGDRRRQQPRPRHLRGRSRCGGGARLATTRVGDRGRGVGGTNPRRRSAARYRRVRCGPRRRSARARRRPDPVGARPRGRAGESEVLMDTRFVLPQGEIPTAWYNALPDLPEPMQPPLHPGTKEPVGPDDLAPLFPMALIEQEMTGAPTVDIPGPVLDILRLWRPTPLVRATRLEEALGTPARIYYKDESLSPAGSHKPNTAVAQAYYNMEAGTSRLATETGAGQWGTALAFACAQFDLECKVYMVRASFEQKPYRKILMETWGASVVPSPVDDEGHPGSLGLASSDAVRDAASRE